MRRREFNQALLAAGFCLFRGQAQAANASWKLVQEMRHSSDINVEQIDLSADGKSLASWASDGSLALWNVAQNRKLWGRSEKCYLNGNRTDWSCMGNFIPCI